MQYNSMQLIQGTGPRQGVYVQQPMAAQPRPPGVYIQQGYPGGYMANYPPQPQMVIQQQPEMLREPPVGPVPPDLIRAQQMQNIGAVLAAPQTQQLMNAPQVFVPNGIQVPQMSINGEEYIKNAQSGQVRGPPYLTQRGDHLQQLQPNSGANGNTAQFVSTIQGIPLYSPDAQANLHVLSPPQGQQYLIEHSPVQLAQHHQQPQFAHSPHNIAQQQQQTGGGGGSIYIVPSAEGVSQGPSLLSPCATTVVDSLQPQPNNMHNFTQVTQALNPIQATGCGVVNSLAGLVSPVQQQTIPQLSQSIPNNAAAVVQTVGTITMVTCGGSLNTVVVSMPGGFASQPAIPGVASVNIVSATQRPVCSVNLVNQSSMPQSIGQNVLPGIGSLMAGGGVSASTPSDETTQASEPLPPLRPQITLLKTETTVLSTASDNSGSSTNISGEVKDSISAEKQFDSHKGASTSLATETGISEGEPESVVVPYGWRRELQDGVILYYSPSGTVLRSHEEVCDYITAENTCKCGLLCPLRVETCFNFDVTTSSRPWTLEDASCSHDLTKLCEHKHKIVTMATLHSSSAQMQQQLVAGASRDGPGVALGFAEPENGRVEKTTKKGIRKKKKKAKPAVSEDSHLLKGDVQETISNPSPQNSLTAGLVSPLKSPPLVTSLTVTNSSNSHSELLQSSQCSAVMRNPIGKVNASPGSVTVKTDTPSPTRSSNTYISSTDSGASPADVASQAPTSQGSSVKVRPDLHVNAKNNPQYTTVQGNLGPSIVSSQGHLTSPGCSPVSMATCRFSAAVSFPVKTSNSNNVQTSPKCTLGNVQNPQNLHGLTDASRILFSSHQAHGTTGQGVLYSLANQQDLQQMSYVQSHLPTGSQSHPSAVSMPTGFYNNKMESSNFIGWNVKDVAASGEKPLKKKRARKATTKKGARNNNNASVTLTPGKNADHTDGALENSAAQLSSTADILSGHDRQTETTASFLENPTAFMAQQTAIVNSSLPGTSPPHKPLGSGITDPGLLPSNAILSTTINATPNLTQDDSEIVKLLNAPTPSRRKAGKRKSSGECDTGLRLGARTASNNSNTLANCERTSHKPAGIHEEEGDSTSKATVSCHKNTVDANRGNSDSSINSDGHPKLCSEKHQGSSDDNKNNIPGETMATVDKQKRGVKHKPGPIDTSGVGSLADSVSSTSLGSPPVAMSTPKMSTTMPLGHIQSPGIAQGADCEENAGRSRSVSASSSGFQETMVQNNQVPVSSPLMTAGVRNGPQQPQPGVLHGRYRLGTPAVSSDQKAFLPASQMLSAAARAQTGSNINSPMFSPAAGSQPQPMPTAVNPQQPPTPTTKHHMMMSPPPPQHALHQGQGYSGAVLGGFAAPQGHIPRMGAPGLGGPMFNRGQRFGPGNMQQQLPPGGGDWQQNRMMFVERQMRPGMPQMQPGQAFPGPWGNNAQKSPIQMVQNMIYGLQASQNALAVAMQPEVPNKRRRKSTSSEGSGRSSARPNSVSSMEYGGPQMMYDGAQYQFHPHPQASAMDVQGMFIPSVAAGNQSVNHPHPQAPHLQAQRMLGPEQKMMHNNPNPAILPNMVMQVPHNDMQVQPPGIEAPPPGMQGNLQPLPGYLQQQQMMVSGAVAMETTNIITGVNNGVAVVMQQEAVPGVSEMLPTLPVAMPTMSVTMVTATTNAIADVISSPAVLTQGQHQYPNVEVNSMTDAQQTAISTPGVDFSHMSVTESPVPVTSKSQPGTAGATPGGKAKKQCKKKKKSTTGEKQQPVLTGTIAKILESAKREMEAQKQQAPSDLPESRGKTGNPSSSARNLCRHTSPVTSSKVTGSQSHLSEPNPCPPGSQTSTFTNTSDQQMLGRVDSAATMAECQSFSVFSKTFTGESFEAQPAGGNHPMEEISKQKQTGGSIGEVNCSTVEEEIQENDPRIPAAEPDTQLCDNLKTGNSDNFSVMNNEDENSVNSQENEYDNIPDEETDSEDNFAHGLELDSRLLLHSNNHHCHLDDNYADGSNSVHRKTSPPSILKNLYAGHIDLLSTSYAIRTPRVFTSAKARSAARILRKARKGGVLRKVKRSFPGQLGGEVTSSPDGGLSGDNCLESEKNATVKKRSRCIDKNFNSCSPTSDKLDFPHEDALEDGDLSDDDNDSATHSHSEMDTSRCSQSSDTSGHTEVNDPATDDSGINCEPTMAGGERERDPVTTAIGSKRVFQQSKDEDSRDSLSRVKYSRHFNVGDVVWGESRGFPSWPGKLVHESDVKGHYNGNKLQEGKLWVRWFGNHTFAQVEPRALKTLSEGLEAHHRERQHFRKGRKLSRNLDDAIQEAMGELDRQTPNMEVKVTANSTGGNSTLNNTDLAAPNRVKLVKKKKR